MHYLPRSVFRFGLAAVVALAIDGVNPQNPRSGQVAVAYGGPGGTRAQIWSEDNIWYPGASEANDQFGGALAVGDFDRDGYDDLAVGRPGEFVNGVRDGNGTTQMFSVPLPGMQNAVINHAFAGMFAGHDVGTAGTLYLDEFVFKR